MDSHTAGAGSGRLGRRDRVALVGNEPVTAAPTVLAAEDLRVGPAGAASASYW